MSSVTPGRATDALVAEKLGILKYRNGCMHAAEGRRFYDGYCVHQWKDDVGPTQRRWSPSEEPADAISALEATGKGYDLHKFRPEWGDDTDRYRCRVFWASDSVEAYAPTLCTAICAAILQLPRGEG